MTYLTEAFRQMNLLESNEYTFDNAGATKLANFMEGDMLNDFEAIIDPEAETVEDLKDSYIGHVVCECQVCKSMIYKEPETITIDEETALANEGECCPYCYERGGFKIIGQIAPYEDITVEAEGDVDVKVNGAEVEPTGRHTRDNEDIEDSQRFPVEGTKQIDLTEKKSKRHAKDNEDLEDSQRYPIKSPVGTKAMKESCEDDADFDEDLDNIHEVSGTVANALMSVKKEIDACGNDIVACKNIIRRVLSSDAVSDRNKPAAEAIMAMLDTLKTPAHFWASFARWIGAPKSISSSKIARHKKDNEDLEDSQRYPVETPVPPQTGAAMMEGMSNREKLKRAFPELNLDGNAKSKRHARDNEDIEDSQRYPIESPAQAQTGLRENGKRGLSKNKVGDPNKSSILVKDDENEGNLTESQDSNIDTLSKLVSPYSEGKVSVVKSGSLYKVDFDYNTQAGNIYERLGEIIKVIMKAGYMINKKSVDDEANTLQFMIDASQIKESLKEGMEDISITTDDQVIKVKATPRADKEAIQPLDAETQVAVEAEPTTDDDIVIPDDNVVVDDTAAEEDIEIDEFDEESFDELGESYLKKVYENVASYKTEAGSIDGNKLILEGVIRFNSGKSAKTKFVFESHTKTKTGKLKFKGINEHITSNKNSYMLTGAMNGSKLVLESLNYNYGAKSTEGTSKRLYGTVRRK